MKILDEKALQAIEKDARTIKGALNGQIRALVAEVRALRAEPMQPVGLDDHNVVRFRHNAVVRALLDEPTRFLDQNPAWGPKPILSPNNDARAVDSLRSLLQRAAYVEVKLRTGGRADALATGTVEP